LRFIVLHLSQIFFTEALTFMPILSASEASSHKIEHPAPIHKTIKIILKKIKPQALPSDISNYFCSELVRDKNLF